MGCSISKPFAAQACIRCQDDIKIDPSLFILQNPHRFHTVYRLGRIIGIGSCGEVRLCFRRDNGARRAVKIIRKRFISTPKAQFLKELNVLKTLDHPNIIRIYESFEERSRMYLVMEYCDGGQLLAQIAERQSFTETEAKGIMRQIFSAVTYLHTRGIVHRDLKPENALLTGQSSDVKIADFGAAVSLTEATIVGKVGTTAFIAPEVLSNSYNELCDMWSCGVILYLLLSGRTPFQGPDDDRVIELIQAAKIDLQAEPWPNISSSGKDLIRSLLCPADIRLSAKAALSHHWLLSGAGPSSDNIKLVLRNLRRFNKTNKLRDAVEIFLISQYMSSNDLKALKEVFCCIDTNNDGKLSREELLAAFKSNEELLDGVEEVESIMKAVDSDCNGFIDYTEFIKACLGKNRIISRENLKAAFSMFDADGSGAISAEELRKILQGNAHSREEVWLGIIKEIDQNGDGEIDLREFEDLLLSSN